MRSIILKNFFSVSIRRNTRSFHLLFTVIFLAAFLATNCKRNPETKKHWTRLLPKEAPVVFTPRGNPPLDTLLNAPYIPYLNNISASSINSARRISETFDRPLNTIGLYLFPSSANHWKPVWITRGTANHLKKLGQTFRKPYTRNSYYFKNHSIHILHLDAQQMFAAHIGNTLIFSENSLALEEAIRSYSGISPSLKVKPGRLDGQKLLLNTPFLDQWVKQLAQVTYRPMISDIFKGTEPIILDISTYPDVKTRLLSFSGILPVHSPEASTIISSVSSKNQPFHLDAVIPEQAAGYGIFYRPPTMAPPKNVPHPAKLDSLLLNNNELYRQFASTINPEFALTMFAESGYLSTGEHFFLRRLKNRSKFVNLLEKLRAGNLVSRDSDIYNINSRVLAELLGSPMCTFDEFYLGLTRQSLVLSKRRGLTESVLSDWRRQRVIANQSMHQTIMGNQNKPLSALVVAESKSFLKFIAPYLSPDHYVDALTSPFDVAALGFKKRSSQKVHVKLDTYNQAQTTAPYREKWVYTLGGTEITAPATMADIGGSAREEILFATRAGKIHVLASDGTEILQAATGTNTPIGSPIAYDWYGNGQNIIMQAAGDKIYGWNTRGNSLPQFPMQLGETISAPPRIADVNRDGTPELIVATTDRQIHVLNGRGQNIPGWPQKTNSIIESPPVFAKINQHWSVVAFAANTVHAWLTNGNLRPGFPKFIPATFRGKPLVFEDHIIGNAADGRLYAISTNPPFSDSLTSPSERPKAADSLKVSSIKITGEGLIGSPTAHSLNLKPYREDTLQISTQSTGKIKGTYLLTGSAEGGIYFVNTNGVIRQSYRIGPSLSVNTDPFLKDLQKDGTPELFALTRYGRLFAWNLKTGRQEFSLPQQTMHHPIITDIDDDGNMDLIAQSRNGIRCWSLLNP